MDFKAYFEGVVSSEFSKFKPEIVKATRKEILSMMTTKTFKKKIRMFVERDINSYLNDEALFERLPEKESDELIKKAIRSVLK